MNKTYENKDGSGVNGSAEISEMITEGSSNPLTCWEQRHGVADSACSVED
jgi:hypothetical protein